MRTAAGHRLPGGRTGVSEEAPLAAKTHTNSNDEKRKAIRGGGDMSSLLLNAR